MSYEYDFGDGWQHKITLETVLGRDSDIPFYPYCLEGEMHQPVDDIGGIRAYEAFAKVITEAPSQGRGSELLERYTGDANAVFDPSSFDRDLVNRQLEQLSNEKKALD